MRIAMVGPFGFHPNKTMHSRALGLARPLVQRGHAVTIIMPPWQTPQEAGRQWVEDGVSVQYVPLGGGIVAITRRLLQAVRAWQPDVVHSFKPKAFSGLVAWWLWQTSRRTVRLVTDSDDWEGWGGWNDLAPYSWMQQRFFAWQEQWGLRHCHTLTVASRALQSIAWSQGVPHQQVVYLPNGSGMGLSLPLDMDRLTTDETRTRSELGVGSRPLLLLYSRLFEFETERLVALLQRVQTTVPDVAVLGVGTGLYAQDAARFQTQLEEAGLQEAFIDAGWVEPEALPALLRAADVSIYLMEDTLLNRTKCPVKLADLLLLGIPVVAEDVGQVGEYIVPGQTGLLRRSGDVAGLAEDLIYLLQHPTERKRLRQQAHAHYAAHFEWARLADSLEVAYGAVSG